jgi:Domain of unknown function (DUF1906)
MGVRTRMGIAALVTAVVATTAGAAPARAAGEWLWWLHDYNQAGEVEHSFAWGALPTNCTPMVGDWNGNSTDTVGAVCPNGPEWVWVLQNQHDNGPTDHFFGWGSTGCLPTVGDWDGNGSDTPGTVCVGRNGEWQWAMHNYNQPGGVEYAFGWGSTNGCWPVTGDWNGDRVDTPGLVCPRNGEWQWAMHDYNQPGAVEHAFGWGGTACSPIWGDWDDNSTDTPGNLCRKPNGEYQWDLHNYNRAGAVERSFGWGSTTHRGLVGDWNGDGMTTPGLTAVVGPPPPPPPPPGDILWGVDSTTRIDQPGFLASVESFYGTPQFFGRYLGNDYALTAAEVSLAHSRGIKLLLVKQSGTTSPVSYAAGNQRAAQAVADARGLGVPAGVAIFGNLEADYTIGAGWIQGWYDGIAAAGFAPGFYANPRTGSFNGAYCEAVAANGAIGQSYIWSSNPSPGPTERELAPRFGPTAPSCASRTDAWQYGIVTNAPPGAPNVDTDLARSTSPLW